VVFTPALAARMRVVTLWEVLTLDLGDDPQRSIPLFRGLSKHQARVAALMTSLRHFPAGHKLIHTGDAGREMFVVIHGTMAATVPSRTGSVRVELERGDVVGEVGLFHGRRSADVDTMSDVTLMRLTLGNLERLQKRYPRIGAQLYRNLTYVLAERLAQSTARAR
jgi:CRP-like cAMP-binding protein